MRDATISRALLDLGILIFVGIPLVAFVLTREILEAMARLVVVVALSVIPKNRN